MMEHLLDFSRLHPEKGLYFISDVLMPADHATVLSNLR